MYVYPYGGSGADILNIINGIWITVFGFTGLVMVVFYVFEAISLYRISKNRGYQKPWLAFIPVANSWVLGGIGDNINFCFQKNTRYRVYLLAADCIWSVIYSFYVAMLLIQFPIMFSAMLKSGDPYAVMATSGWMQFTAFGGIVSLLSLGHMALHCICYYKIYQDYAGKNAMLYLILSILLGIAPFLLFSIRNKPSASLYWRNQPPPPPPFGGPPGGPAPYNGQPPYGNPPRG